jgi:hypothetical protein
VREVPGLAGRAAGRGVDLVVVSGSAGDVPALSEPRPTPAVAQALSLVSRTRCERLARLAFELAVAQNRSTVTCATAAGTQPHGEGTLARAFAAVAEDYALIQEWHLPVETVARQLVASPERVEVVLAAEQHGARLAALAAEVAGGASTAPRVSLGDDVAIFEAPPGADGPTGMLMAAVLLLRQVGERRLADDIEHALVVTLNGGTRTPELAGGGAEVGADAFAEVVVANLGQRLPGWRTRPYAPVRPVRAAPPLSADGRDAPLVGVDVFLHSAAAPRALAASLDAAAEAAGMRLAAITGGAAAVHPDAGRDDPPADHVRARFVAREGAPGVADDGVVSLLARLAQEHRWTHVEKLHAFDGVAGFSPLEQEG